MQGISREARGQHEERDNCGGTNSLVEGLEVRRSDVGKSGRKIRCISGTGSEVSKGTQLQIRAYPDSPTSKGPARSRSAAGGPGIESRTELKNPS